ncbi:3-hydroxyacyl-CoA dehydrogenase family protein [Paraburkholderia sp. J10-1]|uniref:3-hydroxyacyl-CoA dehydrogenase family protein n=1 Tax=unclassified Paraburkholderia TaxID=2615204 RepID=UPI0039F14607
MFGSYVDQGFMMLKEGVAPALIENATRAAGMPVGPLAVADEVSLPLQLKVNEQAIADGLDERIQRGAAIDLVRKMERELVQRNPDAGLHSPAKLSTTLTRLELRRSVGLQVS